MATFTYTPSFSATQNSEPQIQKVQFGDGYEQRLRFGLNTNPKQWDLIFQHRTDTERDDILAFLDARGGWEAFDWTPPHGDAGRFVCEQWRSEMLSCNLNTITATFRQVFEQA